jgi:hypothetical protein
MVNHQHGIFSPPSVKAPFNAQNAESRQGSLTLTQLADVHFAARLSQ